jgi:acyl-CoA reductase-like NAD-dependent aldehyde dehydrogenase
MAQSQYTVPFFISGEERESESTFDVTSPATGNVIHKCSGASEADAQAAVDAAVKALPAWRRLPPAKRRNYFLKAADIMESRREELAGYMVDETGGARQWADFNLTTAIDLIRDVAGRLATIEGSVVNTASENVSAMVLKEPFGVVLAIAPW